MKHWKTTLSGLLLAIGGAIPLLQSLDPLLSPKGQALLTGLLTILGALGLGHNAADKNRVEEKYP